MSKEINGFITWIRSFLDDIYAEKGSSGTDLELNLVPKSQNSNGLICISGGEVNYDLDLVYPVGSIYMSVNSTSPSTLFGGTWIQLEDTFLYATSTTSDANSTTATSGSADAVVVSHTHTQSDHTHGMAHTHSHNHKAIGYTNNSGSGSNRRNPTGYSASGIAGTLDTDTDSTTSSKSSTDGASANINSNGVDGTGKNMPPYMKVFMWKRTQ